MNTKPPNQVNWFAWQCVGIFIAIIGISLFIVGTELWTKGEIAVVVFSLIALAVMVVITTVQRYRQRGNRNH